MAHIRKRLGSRGTAWQVRYLTPDRRERTRSFSRKAEAEKFMKTVEADLLRDEWVDPRLGKLTLAEWSTEWWASTVNLRASSRARDDSYLRTHVLPRFGSHALSAIRQPDVRAWVAELSAKGLAPATVIKAYNILSKMMSGAVDAGLIVQSPCRNIKMPKIERDEMRFLSPDEVACLADAIDPRYRAVVLLAAYAGLRFGELCALRVARVHLLQAEVEVVENLTEVRGVLDYGTTKTRAGRRRVPIPRAVADALAAQIAARPDPSSDLVFQAPEGGPIRRSHWRSRIWVPATRAAGLDGLRLHDLRHTAVALWIAAGRHPKEIATWAGHTSAGFVLDRYGHVFPATEDGLRSALDDMIKKAGSGRGGKVVKLPG